MVNSLAISKEKKQTQLAQYAANLERSNAVFFTKYQGITANDLNALRRKLQAAEGGYMVVKNTLAKKALADAGITNVDDLFEGAVATSFCYGDAPVVAKALIQFAKENQLLEVKGGVMDNTVLDLAAIKNLADLPPLEVVRAQLLGVIAGPASQLVGVVASGIRQIMNVINAYAESESKDDTAE